MNGTAGSKVELDTLRSLNNSKLSADDGARSISRIRGGEVPS